jgi:hypothetical protein
MESETKEMKRLLDEKKYDEIYVHIQSQKVCIDVLRSKIDELIE